MTGPPPTPPASGRGEVGLALRDAAARFSFSPTARLDAELLMAHALGITRERLLLDPERVVPGGFAALVERRVRQEPVAYITGMRGFWTIDLAVGPGALVPRADSETLLVAAVAHFGGKSPAKILDLGTGPGTLLLAALDEWRGARGMGVERSATALGYARGNAARLGSAARAGFVIGDWAAAIGGTYDLILANPPYIGTAEVLPEEVRGHEPGEALFAGPDGLDDYRAIAPALPGLLAPGGAAILEIGATQADAVGALLQGQGLQVSVAYDLGGRARALVAT